MTGQEALYREELTSRCVAHIRPLGDSRMGEGAITVEAPSRIGCLIGHDELTQGLKSFFFSFLFSIWWDSMDLLCI